MERKSKLTKQSMLKSKVYQSKEINDGQMVVSCVGIDVKNKLFLNDYPGYPLEIATSCLVSPSDGDKVVAVFDGGMFFLVSVLQKSVLKQDIELDFRRNNLKLFVSSIEFNVSKGVIFNTDEYILKAKTTEICSNLSKYVYNEVYTVAYNSYRSIERTDEIRAKNFFIKVSDTYTLKNKIGVIQSDAILKIDGGQVHMG